MYVHAVKNVGFHSENILLGNNIVWQQENSTKHTARSVKGFFNESGVVLMQ